jgi:hypothetical protein
MSRKIVQAGGLAMALGMGVGGCAGTTGNMPEEAVAGDPKQVSAAIEQSLEKLSALQIVEVNGLVLALPSEATACYGLPCPGSTWEKVYHDERARQAARLGKLVGVAEKVSQDASLAPRPMYEADAAIKALAGLEVVKVAGLVESQPANNPLCYNLPCAEDRAKAERENGLRVARTQAIVDEAKRSGL